MNHYIVCMKSAVSSGQPGMPSNLLNVYCDDNLGEALKAAIGDRRIDAACSFIYAKVEGKTVHALRVDDIICILDGDILQKGSSGSGKIVTPRFTN